jgi:hypothetical protein
MKKSDLRALTQESLEAFWGAVVRRYPHALCGDLSSERTLALRVAAENAIMEWITNNVPESTRE